MKLGSLLVTLVLVAGCSHSPPTPPVERIVANPSPAVSASAAPIASTNASAEPIEPDTPPPPPYDLAADLEARTKAVRVAIGEKTKFEVVEGVFLVAAPSGALGSSAVVSKKAIEAYFNNRFARRPEKVVAVLLFESAKPYDAYCKTNWKEPCTTPFGFYDRETRTVVMNVAPGIGTLTHELVHPIVESDFPKAPDWINEGIASLYEAFSLPKKGEIFGHKNFRHPQLLEQIKKKNGWASLPALFSMSDKDFRGTHEGLNYATARYFCMWMDSQKKLWPFYQAWRDDFAHDPTGEKAFMLTMGKKPGDLDAAWAAWVKAL